MQRLRKWIQPTVPKAIAVSAAAAVYAWLDIFSTTEPVKINVVSQPPRPVVAQAAPTAPELFLDADAEKTQRKATSSKKSSTKKKSARKTRRKAALTTRAARRVRPVRIAKLKPSVELARLVEAELAQDAHPVMLAAVNVTGPLDGLLEEALSEIPETRAFHPNQLVAAAEMDADFWLDQSLPLYNAPQIAVMAKVVGQNFEEDRELIATAKEEAAELVTIQSPAEKEPPSLTELLKPAPVPQAEIQVSKAAEQEPGVSAETVPEPQQALAPSGPAPVAKNAHEVAQTTPDVPESAGAADVATMTEMQVEPQIRPELAQLEPEQEQPPVDPPAEVNTLVNTLEEEEVASIDDSKNVLVAAPELDTQPVTTQSAPVVAPESKPTLIAKSEAVAPLVPQESKTARASGIINGVLQGRFRTGERLASWLSRAGHAEIFLHPSGSRDPQDSVHLGVVRPDEYFQLDRQGLVGEYKLYARFFSKKSGSLRAQIEHPQLISAVNYKQEIDFHVSDQQFAEAVGRQRKVPSRAGVVTIPVFETAGGSEEDPLRGDFRTPRPVPGARVTVQGFENWGAFEADANGNIRIPNVPARSELLIRVEAKGFYPTMKLITVSDTGAHVPVYLIAESKLPAIRYYTQMPQQPTHGMLLGRTFDPAARTPLSGESVEMSFRKSGAVYFSEYQPSDAQALGLFNAWTAMFLGAIPDLSLKATTDLGLFAFLNVTPSFRALKREGKRALFSYIHPGHLNYFEFGRGGQATLRGRLIDPFGGKIPEARVRIVGDKSYEVFTDASNRFRIEGVDYSGQVTLEIEAPGYPTIWHDVSFNTSEADREFEFYILEEDLVEETARQARVKRMPSRGALIGGAEASFFRENAGCVRLVLEDSRGKVVPSEFGPFPFGAAAEIKGDSLCLTKANPGFAYFNLPLGQYRQKFLAEDGTLLRPHIRNVGTKSVTISVN